MLIALTLSVPIVALPAIVPLEAVRPEQTKFLWIVALVASMVNLGVEFMRNINLSCGGCDTEVACG